MTGKSLTCGLRS